MNATCYRLAPDRALVVSQIDGLVVLGVRGPDDATISGPLAVRATNVAAFVAAVIEATGAQLAVDMERVREVLRAAPGIPGYDHLRRALVGVSMRRRRAAVTALRAGGEIIDRGAHRRPRLHLADVSAPYSHGRPPQAGGVALSPCPTPERAESDPYVASRAHPEGAVDVALSENAQ